MTEFQPVICGQCGAQVYHIDGEPRIPCETCGSTARKIGVQISETVDVRANLGMKAKHYGAAGEHKYFIEQKTGWSFHRNSGEWHQVDQVVDRESGRYRKRVVDQDGRVIRDVDEPLSSHRDRGDAKNKTKQ